MKLAIIGKGAISAFVRARIAACDIELVASVVRPGNEGVDAQGVPQISDIADMPTGVALVIDCAGHDGLRAHGPATLTSGVDLLTLSIGALADAVLQTQLADAAKSGGSRLHLASGAIGALDLLRAARCGRLDRVTYVGRKPPLGWMGSPAENRLDLVGLTRAETHFSGSAREAALAYPKNANVAAAVALSSLGFEDTKVELIADPDARGNIHQIEAAGDFGEMNFCVTGSSLADNPRSSALAAMSVLAAIVERQKTIGF